MFKALSDAEIIGAYCLSAVALYGRAAQYGLDFKLDDFELRCFITVSFFSHLEKCLIVTILLLFDLIILCLVKK